MILNFVKIEDLSSCHNQEMIEFRTEPSIHWRARTDISFGEYHVKSFPVVFDTGASIIGLTVELHDRFLTELGRLNIDYRQTEELEGEVNCEWVDLFPPFVIGDTLDKQIVITPAMYMWRMPSGLCRIFVGRLDVDYVTRDFGI